MTTKFNPQLCIDHGYNLIQPSHWSLPHMSINWLHVGLWVGGLALAYEIGRIGVPQFVADVQSVYTWIKGKFSGTQATTASNTSAS